ncbi:rCG56446 [Rattus norvegicus]|uniref:RCG56446 n=1 Tax=Rattus norvegicus TaxID=10116 RepID=A6IB57_RAT|nr:rCG56446 [Rattus norvegicus]
MSSWRLEEGSCAAQLHGYGRHTLSPRLCPISSTPQWAEGSISGLDARQRSPCLSLPLTSFDHFYSR